MSEILTAIGLMSGTSMDGIDAALIETDGRRVHAVGAALTQGYSASFRDELRRAVDAGAADDGLVAELTERCAAAVAELLRQSGRRAAEIDVIGCHGQTLLHDPAHARTVQIGDGARLAALTGIDVVDDFRAADIAAGGEGAPLAPLYHLARARDLEKPVAVLNIGGVANVTWIGEEGPPVAFDTGPGNALIDDWIAGMGAGTHDPDGALAAEGRVDEASLAAFLDHPYFARPGPKSLDRQEFAASVPAGLSLADGAATLTRFTVEAVVRAAALLPQPPRRWLVCGGGRYNQTLMRWLAERLGVPVGSVEGVGWRGDTLEAEAFAFLAVRSLKGLPLSLPTTTGVPSPTAGGRLHSAD